MTGIHSMVFTGDILRPIQVLGSGESATHPIVRWLAHLL